MHWFRGSLTLLIPLMLLASALRAQGQGLPSTVSPGATERFAVVAGACPTFS
jgi:hypothetical protein